MIMYWFLETYLISYSSIVNYDIALTWPFLTSLHCSLCWMVTHSRSTM